MGRGFPKAVDITASGITLKAKIDEDGTAYYVVLAGGSASPSSQQVKSGKDSSDNPVADGRKGSISLTADTVGNTSIFGLDSILLTTLRGSPGHCRQPAECTKEAAIYHKNISECITRHWF